MAIFFSYGALFLVIEVFTRAYLFALDYLYFLHAFEFFFNGKNWVSIRKEFNSTIVGLNTNMATVTLFENRLYHNSKCDIINMILCSNFYC